MGKELSKVYNVIHFSQCVNKKMISEALKGKPTYSRILINKHYEIYQSYNLIYNLFYFLTTRLNAQNFLASFSLRLYLSKTIREKLKEVDLIQVEHPWQYEWAKAMADKLGIKSILSILNFEGDVLEELIPHIPLREYLINYLIEKEQKAYNLADNIIYLSQNDLARFREKNKIIKTSFYLPFWVADGMFSIQRSGNKKQEDITVLFTGSGWQPNVIALELIEKLAEKYSNNKRVKFLIAGSVGENKKNKDNVIYTGRVKSITNYFKKADIFINPVTIGGGVNYKMIEAMASSLPIITTPFGARGIELINNDNAVICDLSQFEENIKELVDNAKLRDKLGKNARKLAIEKYSKRKVVEKMFVFYEKILN